MHVETHEHEEEVVHGEGEGHEGEHHSRQSRRGCTIDEADRSCMGPVGAISAWLFGWADWETHTAVKGDGDGGTEGGKQAAGLDPPHGQPKPVAKPNFSGKWLCVAIEGNMDAYLEASGFGWARRSGASLINYGIGRSMRNIRQSSDDFIIDVDGVTVQFTEEFRVGGGRQRTMGFDGEVWITPTWESGGVLCLQCHKGNEPDGVIEQYCLGEFLALRMTTAGGVRVLLKFERQ